MTRICAVQMAPHLGATIRNGELVAAEIAAAAGEGADLVVFPEAALTGYVFESIEEGLEASVEATGPQVTRVVEAAAAAGAHAVVGAIERESDHLYNTAFVVGPDGLLGRYRKIHTLCLGADRFTRPGGEPPRVFDLPFGRIGVHICYDGSFPETARTLRLLGAQLLVLPTNWPRLDMKRETVRVRANENRAFYLAVNRVGTERGVVFRGGSLAADRDGKVIMEAGDRAGRYAFDVDLESVDVTREVVMPGEYELDLIQDRWPELYGPITEPMEGVDRTGSGRAR
ncbi:MAG: carbon-nitrogen hydrolase family protein [Gemmatimonadota bacterium]|nr:carbon-nitrogen hydrolase family protein [Gemmatimonadota bacterium]